MKTTLKLAIASVFAISAMGTAQAHVLGATPDITLAEEIDYTTAPNQALVAGQVITAPLGFGISSGQEDFIRIDLTGATFAAQVTAGPGPGTLADTTVPFDSSTIANGGAAGSTCVLYRVTGAAAPGNGAGDIVSWELPPITVDDNAVDPTATYRVYTEANDATCALATPAGLPHANVTGPLFNLAPSITFIGDNPITTIAEVAELYHFTQDQDGNGVPSIVELGTVEIDIVGNINGQTGAAVTAAELLAPTTATVTITGDFSAVGLGTVTLAPGGPGACVAPGIQIPATAVTAQTATFDVPVVDPVAPDYSVCYNAEVGTAPNTLLPFQTSDYNASIALTANAATPASLSQIGDIYVGQIKRNGTILRSAFIQGLAGNSTFINVANHSTTDTTFTIKCLANHEDPGNTGADADSTLLVNQPLPAEGTVRLQFNEICPAGAGYNAIELTAGLERGNIVGTVVRENGDGASAFSDMTGNLVERPTDTDVQTIRNLLNGRFE